ncbi:MAG: protein translocase subunit SecF, partial [Elainellaceae cyanobacterium]
MKLQISKQRSLWWSISLALIIASVVAMLVSWRAVGAPLRPSLDFVGGTRLQIERNCEEADCEAPLDLGAVRDVLANQGLANSSLQLLGSDRQALSIRTA